MVAVMDGVDQLATAAQQASPSRPNPSGFGSLSGKGRVSPDSA